MKALFLSLANRFKEPSSWAAITTGLTAIGINIDPSATQAGVYIAAGVAGLIAFFLREKGTPSA